MMMSRYSLVEYDMTAGGIADFSSEGFNENRNDKSACEQENVMLMASV